MLRDLTKFQVCYVLWIKGDVYSCTELEHNWLGKGFSDARANKTRRRVRQADLIAEMTTCSTPRPTISAC